MKNTIVLIADEAFAAHQGPAQHPERPARLVAAEEGVLAAVGRESLIRVPARAATDTELGRVHSAEMLELLAACDGRAGFFDPDTFYSERSVHAARRAAGGAIAMVDRLLSGGHPLGVALLRPPGHHAGRDKPMGFCLLNNAAVAAAHALALGLERVAIVDWDVHHGNGTEEIFYESPQILYLSVHQSAFYPGTGSCDDLGRGAGAGFTVNLPLSAGAGDAAYALGFEALIAPVLGSFAPQLVLVSAGFDAHRRDPLASMEVSDDGYAMMATRLAAGLATQGDLPPIGLLLEGGYDLDGLRGGLAASLRVLAASAKIPELPAPPPASPSGDNVSMRHQTEIDKATRAAARYWPALSPARQSDK